MATIADVARAAGVSIATVSRVLSPSAVPHPVRPATADRVREAAHRLQFVPSPIARALTAGRSGLVGLIVPDLGDPHYPQVASGVEDRARAADLAVLICNTLGESTRMAEYLQLLQARRVEAILLSGATSLEVAELRALRGSAVPIVLIGRPKVRVPWPYVSIDNRGGARAATRHLLKLGRQQIVHLSGPQSQTTMADRARGYQTALGPRLADIVASNGSPEDGYACLAERFDDPARPTPDAVFAATDRLAIAALGLAADRGLHVPRALAIVGFDDLPLGGLLRPTLSTVAQPAHELGTLAVDMAQRLVAGEKVRPVTLPATLVERESTRGPGGRYS